ncbi:hypothetical protein BCR33DRAFT_112076 [Rhizoclosmatium globosum]|uniref:Uncharacterized protein n=1 Tax=Rhizoclosmatium globosum TaxID=329046 RepID=A0A1Y2CKP3_9FUNG|nr:hypothetical protein BCR33DRAFT_112076 [Rhizoclosmatium globosum]|eukprot:ORY46895.1 hypothetical protein BCR33DRAFT_112076 [Rhizoclosmatium globosum]
MSPNLRFSSHLYRAFSHSPLLKVLVILAALVGVQFGQYLALPSSQRCELQHSYKSDSNKPSSLSSNYTLVCLILACFLN